MIRTRSEPSGCIRQRSAISTVSSRATQSASGTPSAVAAAIAARAFMTWCSPSTRRRTGSETPSAVDGEAWFRMPSPRRRPPHVGLRASRPCTASPRPNQRTAASRSAAIEAIVATRASSALSTASPPRRSARTSSDFAAKVASMPPKPPACAMPTMSTTPTSGSTRPARRAISPGALAPNSLTRYRVSYVTRSIVSGAPTSLLNDACGDTVSPTGSRMRASRFFVVVLPLEPVIPTIAQVAAARGRGRRRRGRGRRAPRRRPARRSG